MVLRRSTRPKWRWWLHRTPAPPRCGWPIDWRNFAIPCRRRRRKSRSVAARGGDGVQAVIAEHMRHQARGLEYLCKRRIANAQAPGIGAERGHHRALAVAGKTAPLHRTSACRHPRLGMQMTGDFTGGTCRLVTKRNWPDGDFAGDHAAEIAGERGIVIAGNPDPVAPRLQRRERVAIPCGQPAMGGAVMKTVAERDHHARIVPRDHGSEAP